MAPVWPPSGRSPESPCDASATTAPGPVVTELRQSVTVPMSHYRWVITSRGRWGLGPPSDDTAAEVPTEEPVDDNPSFPCRAPAAGHRPGDRRVAWRSRRRAPPCPPRRRRPAPAAGARPTTPVAAASWPSTPTPCRPTPATSTSTLDSLTENVDDQLGQLESARAALREVEHRPGVGPRGHRGDRDEDRRPRGPERRRRGRGVHEPAGRELARHADRRLAVRRHGQESILDTQADTNAGVLGDLADAREELEAQQADESELEDAYAGGTRRLGERAGRPRGAQSQQALFIAQVQERLDKNLSEAEALQGHRPRAGRLDPGP